ncbi:MAG TPA: hypothetical protein VMR18_00835 [Candidatus Saccharimonadales bacterium]|nr:hypothetical protein [Candidatus Saccharimonadales bacterium]
MLELSLASNNEIFGLRDLRRDDIRSLKNPVKRLGATAVDELAHRSPSLATAVLDLLSRHLTGRQFIGYGAEYSVYSDGDNVTKVHRDSVNWTESQRLDYVAAEVSATALLCETMGSMAISQRYRIGEHPFGIYRAVIAEQPFVDGVPLALFTTNKTEVNRSVVTEYCETVTTGQASLATVIEATHKLYDRERMVPDTNGAGNFVVVGDERSLAIIDPQPVTDVRATTFIMHQVDSLAEFLAVA